eukprot:gnl/MRDRNA2_/MRDRNA2_27626_c0_seq1.p1 gnl/MRDRNA2_/MRDRNA2_27626_c0~~gnl/MRDRNA2_/MRDRNA2_27626_c0_seq1.p1  ORF type:complete len:153 (+),score=11.75 gnl/MRDRNA2_/MRDRNA2_27626_c0_seq1:1019-1477(+)
MVHSGCFLCDSNIQEQAGRRTGLQLTMSDRETPSGIRTTRCLQGLFFTQSGVCNTPDVVVCVHGRNSDLHWPFKRKLMTATCHVQLVLHWYWTWIGSDEINRVTVAEELTQAKTSPRSAMVQERKLRIRQIWNICKNLQSGHKAAGGQYLTK